VAVLSAHRRGRGLGWLLVAAMAAGARPAPTERDVQAAFLCSFADYVEWPDLEPDSPVVLLVLGDDPFGAVLDDTAAGPSARRRRVTIRRSRRLEEAVQAQIVFVSSGEQPRLRAVLTALDEAAVLSVSDAESFARRGGMVGFVVEQRRVRFEINQRAAERAGLRISSRLLSLARIVEGTPGRE
jgi:hypothetical protein